MGSATVDQHLGEWLEPATVERSPDEYTRWRKAISAMSKSLDSRLCLEVTAAAHANLSETGRAWIGDRIREQDPGFPAGGNDLLLAILAGAVVIETLETSNHAQRSLAALLVESAQCTQLVPQVPAVRTTAAIAARDCRRSVRVRGSEFKSLAKELGDQIAAVTKLDAAAPDWNVVSGVLISHETALRAAASRLDDVSKYISDTLRLQDEELNTLWWSYGGISTTVGEAWAKVLPLERRAILASCEVRDLLTRTPSPASSRSLLAHALGKDAEARTSVAAIAGAATGQLSAFSGIPEHRLIPIASAAFVRQRLGGEDDTWKTVVARTLEFDVATELSLLDAAEQVLRELDIRASL